MRGTLSRRRSARRSRRPRFGVARVARRRRAGSSRRRRDRCHRPDCSPATGRPSARTIRATRRDANAGGAFPTPFEQSDVDYYRQTIALNLDAVPTCSQASVPVFVENGGGVFLATSSGGGISAVLELTAYGAAKAGVQSLVKGLRSSTAPWVFGPTPSPRARSNRPASSPGSPPVPAGSTST